MTEYKYFFIVAPKSTSLLGALIEDILFRKGNSSNWSSPLRGAVKQGNIFLSCFCVKALWINQSSKKSVQAPLKQAQQNGTKKRLMFFVMSWYVVLRQPKYLLTIWKTCSALQRVDDFPVSRNLPQGSASAHGLDAARTTADPKLGLWQMSIFSDSLALLNAKMSRISVSHVVIAYQRVCLSHIMDIRCSPCERMYISAPGINTGTDFHSETPLVTFFIECISGSRSLVRFFVDLRALMSVASTTPPSYTIKPFFPVCSWRRQTLPCRFHASEEMTKVQRRYCVGHVPFREIDLRKRSHGMVIVDRVLYAFVGQIEPTLHDTIS